MKYQAHFNKHGVTLHSRDPRSNPWICWVLSWRYGGCVSRCVNHRDGTLTETVFCPLAWLWRQGPFWSHRTLGMRVAT